MSDYGLLEEVRAVERGSTLDTAASIGDTELVVEYAGDFNYDPDDPDDSGGILDLNGARLTYTSIVFGELPADPDTIVLAAPLTAAADEDDSVFAVGGGQILTDYVAYVTMGEGDQVAVPLTVDQQSQWPVGVYLDPVPVVVSDDLLHLEDAPGRTAAGRVEAWNKDAATVASDDAATNITLTYTPLDNSLQVKKNGIDLLPAEWTRDAQHVSVQPSADVILRAGDTLAAYYLYDAAAEAIITPSDPVDFADQMISLSPTWWDRLGEAVAATTAVDSSGNGHDGTASSVTFGATGLVAGDSDTASTWIAPGRIVIPYGSWMNGSPISGFILFKTTNADLNGICLMSRWDASIAELWSFDHVAGNIRLRLNGGATVVSTTGLALNDGAKQMAGFTLDGTTARLFTKNGLVKSQAVSVPMTGSVPLTTGADYGGGGGSLLHHFVGTLDEAAYWAGIELDTSDFADLWAAAS